MNKKIISSLCITACFMLVTIAQGKTYHSSGADYRDHQDNNYQSSENYDQSRNFDRDRDRDKREDRDHRYRIGYGWNPPKEVWKWNPECHHFTLRVSPGGPASARIESIPGDNKSFRVGEGVYKGYVCYKDGGRLMLAKQNPATRIKLSIDSHGDFIFGSGDRGQKYANHWYRAYWGL